MSNFLEKWQEYSDTAKELAIKAASAKEQIDSIKDPLLVKIDNLLGKEIPVVNGNPVITVDIDKEKLGNYSYVKGLITKIKSDIETLEQVGSDIMDDAMKSI